jgi:hypothetical protein
MKITPLTDANDLQKLTLDLDQDRHRREKIDTQKNPVVPSLNEIGYISQPSQKQS